VIAVQKIASCGGRMKEQPSFPSWLLRIADLLSDCCEIN
jgi:hypothetical protein